MRNRLRDLREDRDFSQRQIADILNMSQTGYSKYETGENDIPTDILLKLADFYEVSVDYLLGRNVQPVSGCTSPIYFRVHYYKYPRWLKCTVGCVIYVRTGI